MKMENPYSSGQYYKETYMKNQMSLKMSTRWMVNYYNVIKKIYPLIVLSKNNKILEIGSGFGGFINVLNDDGYINVSAADMSANIFSKEIKNKFIILDLLNIVDINEKFDIIFAFDVFEHINNTAQVINNISQLLNINGLIIFSVPYPVKKHLMDNYHTNMQYPNYYSNLFKQGGYELINMEDVSFCPFLWRLRLPIFYKYISKNKFVISETFFIFKKQSEI